MTNTTTAKPKSDHRGMLRYYRIMLTLLGRHSDLAHIGTP